MKPPVLLTRNEFSAAVLARTGGCCCAPGCEAAATAAHHIIERRLFTDGGYYIENGAPLCDAHHLAAEHTTISPSELRAWLGIKRLVQPPQFEDDELVDKWGNPVLANGSRLRGELFDEEPVQKALAAGGVLSLFRTHVKHPKTWHMPTSPGLGRGDRMLKDLCTFEGERVIMTEKRDGECSSLYRDHTHARSLDGRHHPSRDWLRAYWSAIRWDIPELWRVVGEGTYARHSIAYADLPSYFEGFGLWNERNFCLSWDETLEWFALIGSSAGLSVTPVPVIYDGIYAPEAIEEAWQAYLARDIAQAEATGRPLQQREGYVIRTAAGFAYRDFRKHVAKWVRPNHVITSEHWMHAEITPNELAEDRDEAPVLRPVP
ncbi:RNA ligase family protein [Bosea sp. ANAM02]|uniref:RNA ligase family protein n=1 Tax=Bosea sp. ANAM02 TaxID=2020412 RepID=UPI00140EA9BA|nr:RNA ligase family protein [Bosea sp. ANAM02]BCB22356.1 hypothetical protein OCUBac02_52500 [Bosea sp. ANAM02]